MNILLFENLISRNLLAQNLLAWSAEIAILAIAATTASYALRHARARLYFWQSILAAALLLPVAVPWKQSIEAAPPVTVTIVPAIHGAPVSQVPARTHWGIEQVFMLIAVGAALRLMWVVLGLLRLTRIRKSARPLVQPPVAFAGNASWYVSDQVRSPVTFGWLKPSILLPASVRELSPGAQEAIASHELFHVHRRDWLFVIAEELVRSVLWFHPAVWFVLSRIQLAREQVVDQEVVRATRDRAGYLNALVSVAAHRFEPDISPAPLFLKKRQLAVRVQALLKETSMSASRLAAHVSLAASVALIGVGAAVWFFPLRSAAQTIPDDPGITVDPGAALAHRTPVHNPTAATGDVLLELKLNSKGEVDDARVLSGPDELRKPALASALDWHYLADTAPPALVHATIHFGPRLSTVTVQAPPPPPPPPPVPPGGRSGRSSQGAPPPPPPPPPLPESATVRFIQYSGLSPELQQRVQNHLSVREGDTLKLANVDRIREDLQRDVDEHLSVGMRVTRNYGTDTADIVLTISLPAGATPVAYRIGGGVSAPVPIVKPEPQYSEEARAAKWQGAVLLQLVIDENGVPRNIQVVRALGLGLDENAIEAVQQWRFRPGVKDGQAVPVTANIEVNFRLPGEPNPTAAAPGSRAVGVGGAVMDSRVIQKVAPVYPPTARTARIQGTVQVSVTIGTDGKVQDVQPVSGPGLLLQAAVDAVRQWVYQPFLLNGQPVSVQTTANVNFVLD